MIYLLETNACVGYYTDVELAALKIMWPEQDQRKPAIRKRAKAIEEATEEVASAHRDAENAGLL